LGSRSQNDKSGIKIYGKITYEKGCGFKIVTSNVVARNA